MSAHRVDKVEKLIKEQVSYILLHKMPDDDLGFITVTEVKVSADLKIAKVYLSVLHKERRDFVINKINSRLGHIRTELAHGIRIKFVPELKFFIDDTLDYVEKIEGLINEIHKQNNNQSNT
ncbi:MAG: 30S ribosome-binding factor RbfA [Ignavibacteriales bacterium]